jgi:cadmium resistance protein CadD (predicted permease)
MLFSKINALLAKAEVAYGQLNGWKKIMVNAILLAIPYFELFSEWVQTASGVFGLVLLVWSIVKGWYQVALWKEDLKMKKRKNEIEQQDWLEELERRKRKNSSDHDSLPKSEED